MVERGRERDRISKKGAACTRENSGERRRVKATVIELRDDEEGRNDNHFEHAKVVWCVCVCVSVSMCVVA